jgi:hypothetical protein
MVRVAAAVFLIAISSVPTAQASNDAHTGSAATTVPEGPTSAPAQAPRRVGADVEWFAPPPAPAPASRGSWLPALYVGLGGLNVVDGYTTMRGLARGATEANPLMRGIGGHSAALWAVKGGATAGSVYLAERLWRQNRRGAAIAVMALSNGMMAVVAANNARVLKQLR